ncbi:ATPase, V1 complex, subunit C like protein [Aduncisulcus paluster]|uniref:V-type proton ATPase subunit C n=1 Tax=Aduncisulcus paluster TaxID=2918883 RepID=A0ABQ5KP41_9EUKA|nr:ATPase, V1 complex, subunit C like protein [Aduncisulcus paluster]
MSYYLLTAPIDDPAVLSISSTFPKEPFCHDVISIDSTTLPIGMLDSLLDLSEELPRKIINTKNVFNRVKRLAADVGETADEKRLLDVISQTIKDFRWNEMRFPLDLTLEEMVSSIQEAAEALDEVIRTDHESIAELKQEMTAITRKTSGDLAIRDLTGIISPRDIIDSEFMRSVFLIVSADKEDFVKKEYQTWHEYIVPESLMSHIHESNFSLYSFVCFKKDYEEIVAKIRIHGIGIRDLLSEDMSEPVNYAEKKETVNLELRMAESEVLTKLDDATKEIVGLILHMCVIAGHVEGCLRLGVDTHSVSYRMNILQIAEGKERLFQTKLSAHLAHLLTGGFSDDAESGLTPWHVMKLDL